MSDRDLYRQLAEAIGAGESTLVQQIFQALVNEDEAKILLAAAPPGTAEEIAERSGYPKGEVEEALESLFMRGLIFKSKKADSTRYYRVRSIPQMHDSTVLTPGISRSVLDLWKKYMKTEWPAYGGKVMDMMPKSIMRVVPVNEYIEPEARIMPYDDIAKIIDDAQTLSVTKCSCRVIDGSCGKPLEVCMQVDRAAEYNIERGTGRQLTKEEAIEILKLCEEEGLVHCVDNSKSVGHVICNCCNDCCLNWAVMEGPKKWVSPSRYLAVVDDDLCTGCEACLERCFFDALSMAGDVAAVDAEKCLGCGVCTVVCPVEALKLKEIRDAEFVPG